MSIYGLVVSGYVCVCVEGVVVLSSSWALFNLRNSILICLLQLCLCRYCGVVHVKERMRLSDEAALLQQKKDDEELEPLSTYVGSGWSGVWLGHLGQTRM